MIALVTGCNGASDDGSTSPGNSGQLPPPSEGTSTLSAENTVNLSRNMSSSHVLLEGKIHSSSQKGNNIVSSVSPLTDLESCQDISVDSTGYSVSFDDFVGVCVYKYDATNSAVPDQRASAYAISVAQKSVDNEVALFTPISETTLVGETLVIDLKNDPNFVTEVPEGYTMDQDVTLIGEGEATADDTNQTITYTPTEDSGFAKIIYSYSNGSEVKLGNIAISVSTSANSAPIAPNIDYSNDPNGSRVNANEGVIIDLSTYVSDEDGDSLELIYVDSWNAAVSPLDTEDMNNLKLRFETTKVGEHFVSYGVSDHYGGYASGMLRIEVYDSEAAPNWGNLPLEMKYYFAPLVKSEADAQGVTYTSTHIDVGANNANVATFNFQQAKDLCKASGRLPTAEELAALANIGGIGPAVYDGWPVEIDYWALDSGSASIVSLKSGQTSETPNAGGQYVTCVGEGGYRIDSANSKLVAIGDGEDQASVAVQATFNGEPLEGITVEAEVTGSANLVSTSLKTDANGHASFNVVDAISEQVTFTTNLEGSTVTPRSVQLQFTGNPNTADLQLTAVTDNQPMSGVNVFESSLKDATGAPVAGQKIDYQNLDHLTFTLSSESTNSDGKQTVSVSTDVQGEEEYPYIVDATYIRPDGSQDTQSLDMTFSNGRLESVHGESGNYALDPHHPNSVTVVVHDERDTPNEVTLKIKGPAVFTANGSKELTTDAYTPTEGSEHSLTQTIKYDNADDNEKVPQENITYDVEVTAYGQTITTPQFFTGMPPQIVGKSGRVYVQLPRKADGTAYSYGDVYTACQDRGFEPPSTDHYGLIGSYDTSWYDDIGFETGGEGAQGAKALFDAGWQHNSWDKQDLTRMFGMGGRCNGECRDIDYLRRTTYLEARVTPKSEEEQGWEEKDEGAREGVEVDVTRSEAAALYDVTGSNNLNVICLVPKNNS
ncbi:Ig-like domain-containing protein [Vibrio sp. 10N.286.45.E10]|uniref:Ig-like domain-containing protein n=1 Tax=Vibrio sp. 10N.286.45.E10 TaxID=1884476 RepID=UPI0039A42627